MSVPIEFYNEGFVLTPLRSTEAYDFGGGNTVMPSSFFEPKSAGEVIGIVRNGETRFFEIREVKLK